MALPPTPEAGIPHFRDFTFSNIRMRSVESKVFAVSAAAGSSYEDFRFANVDVDATSSTGATVGGGSIRNADRWTFTHTSIHDASGNPVPVAVDPATTTDVTGINAG